MPYASSNTKGFNWQQRTLSVTKVQTRPEFQLRVQMDDRTLRRYTQDWKEGAAFPPIHVADINGHLCVVDGFHRLLSAQWANKRSIPALVAPMSHTEAEFYALTQANTRHGLGLKQRDKQAALDRYVEKDFHLRSDGSQKPTRQIEEELGRIYSHVTIWAKLKAMGIERTNADGGVADYKRREASVLLPSEVLDELAASIAYLREVYMFLENPDHLRAFQQSIANFAEEIKGYASEKDVCVLDI